MNRNEEEANFESDRRILDQVKRYDQLDDKTLDHYFKEREVELKRRELALKEKEARKGRSSPLLLAVSVAALALIGNVYVQAKTSKAQLELQRANNKDQLDIQERKEVAERIVDALKPANINDRCTNLLLLEGLGLTGVQPRIAALCVGTLAYQKIFPESLVQSPPASAAKTNELTKEKKEGADRVPKQIGSDGADVKPSGNPATAKRKPSEP